MSVFRIASLHVRKNFEKCSFWTSQTMPGAPQTLPKSSPERSKTRRNGPRATTNAARCAKCAQEAPKSEKWCQHDPNKPLARQLQTRKPENPNKKTKTNFANTSKTSRKHRKTRKRKNPKMSVIEPLRFGVAGDDLSKAVLSLRVASTASLKQMAHH